MVIIFFLLEEMLFQREAGPCVCRHRPLSLWNSAALSWAGTFFSRLVRASLRFTGTDMQTGGCSAGLCLRSLPILPKSFQKELGSVAGRWGHGEVQERSGIINQIRAWKARREP